MLEVDLPKDLLIYKDKIEATIKPFIEIKANPENNLNLWQSKFGGLPYFPKNLQYPIDSKGKAMFLLAQINFSETPKLASFPEKGILQFYISGGSDLYGWSSSDLAKQEDFRVLYFSEVTEDEHFLLTKFDFLPEPYNLPIWKQSSLTFNLKFEPIPIVDCLFESKILNLSKPRHELYQDINFNRDYENVYDEYEKLFHSEGHKIGGYPFFTQHDPRECEPYKDKGYILLFQMDSDDEANIMWGDVGVANFFITEQDLASKNFSRVLYNWDCS